MAPIATRVSPGFYIVLALLFSYSLAWTIPILGLGAAAPPAALLTADMSPQCASTNNGTYLCCSSAVQGGDPIVVAASDAAGYELPANTVNGLECQISSSTCSSASTPLCCQVITLLPVAGLWCQYM